MAALTLRVRDLRTALGFTQQELADKAGVRQATVSAIESGTTTRIDLDVLAKLATALGVDPAVLLVRGNEMSDRELPYFGSVPFTDADGNEWTASSRFARGVGSGTPPDMQTCVVEFNLNGQALYVHRAPLNWKEPAVLAVLFKRAQAAPQA